MNEMGGTRAVVKGNLKRRLVSTTIATISPGEAGEGTTTVRALVSGLTSVLSVGVGVGGFSIGAEGNTYPFYATSWPVGAGTMQITPQNNPPDRGKTPFRPVFQDPTNVLNVNAPLPQALPFDWNFPGEADEAVIDIILDLAAWATLGVTVDIVLEVWVEYTGPWWDVEAVTLAMGQVTCTAPTKAVVIAS